MTSTQTFISPNDMEAALREDTSRPMIDHIVGDLRSMAWRLSGMTGGQFDHEATMIAQRTGAAIQFWDDAEARVIEDINSLDAAALAAQNDLDRITGLELIHTSIGDYRTLAKRAAFLSRAVRMDFPELSRL